MNVVCDVDLSSVSVSGCEIVEQQTFSLSRKRDASVALACERKMNIEGLLVKAYRPTPNSSPFKSCVRMGKEQSGASTGTDAKAYLLCPTDVTGIVEHRGFVFVKNEGMTFGGRRRAVCDRPSKNGNRTTRSSKRLSST